MSKMLRLLALAIAVLIFQPAVEAVGLGSATVRSHLNEPLDAVIPVSLSGNETLANTEVGLASIEDFRRVGLDYSAAMGQLRFELVESADGIQARVTSQRAIRDPFVTFLLEVQSPSGRVLRQYTLLIDPSPEVRSRPAATPSTRPDSAPAERPGRRPAETAPGRRAPAIEGDYTVQAGDTLYEIAARMRPEGVDINTMIAALYRTNPDAFYQANINSLSRGARLDMPTQSTLDGLSREQVNQLIRQHNTAWQQGRLAAADRAPVVEGGARDAAAVGQPERTERRAEPRLALVPPSGDTQDAGADTEELRRDLTRTEEELASARLEAEDMRSRVDELETITEQQENVISMRDAELAQLREQLAQMRERAEAVESDVVVDTRPTERTPAPVEEPDVADEPVVEAPPPVAEEPASRREMPVTADSAAGGMMGTLMLLGLLLLVVLLLAGGAFWFMRRRQAAAVGAGSASMLGGDDQASQDAMTEALLIENITESPDDPQARLSLLRFYFEGDRADAFVGAAQEMHERIDEPEDNEYWQAAVAMGEQIAPQEPLFGGDGETDATEALDIDGDNTQQAEPAFDDPDAFDEDFGDDDFASAFEQTDNLKNLEEQLPSDAEESSPAEDDWTSEEFAGLDDDFEDSKPPSDTDIAETLAEQDDDEDLEGLDFDLGDTRDATGGEFDTLVEDADEGDANTAKAKSDEGALDFGDDDDGLDLDLDDSTLDDVADSASASLDDGAGEADEDDFNLDDSMSADVSNEQDEGDELSFDLDADLDAADDDTAADVGEQKADSDAESAEGDDEEAFDLDFDLGDEDLFAEGDAVATKLSLAEAYIDEGQADDARGMLEEVIIEGDEDQKAQAQALLDKL